jgi:hypothetical protein
MIRLRVRCQCCDTLNPGVQVIHFGWQHTQCSACGELLKVDASPDAVLDKPKTRAYPDAEPPGRGSGFRGALGG